MTDLQNELDSISTMSDEQFLNAPIHDFSTENNSEETEEEQFQEDGEQEEMGQDTEEEESFEEPQETDSEENEQESDEDKNNEETSDNDPELDYKEAYDKIFAPFKANGREISVKNADEVVRLMQMGAGFHRRMAELKPAMRIVRTLENNNLLDEGKLSHLIDLANHDPQAIKHLLKESRFDTMDYDSEEELDYKPKAEMVSDGRMALNDTLDENQGREGYQPIMGAINNWDEESQKLLAQHPSVITMLIDQKENGIYDAIMDEVAREKALGNLTGLSELMAYKQIGDRMQAQGELANFGAKVQQQPTDSTEETQPRVSKKPKNADRERRRRSVSSTVTTAPKSATRSLEEEFNRISRMSDEEFSKLEL